MAAKRLTRKEIVRQDRIQQTLTETSSWLVRNLNYILITAAILVLSLATGYLWQSYQQSRQAELQTRFSDALAKYHGTVAEQQQAEETESAGAETSPFPATKYEFSSTQERSESALSDFRELSEQYPGTRLGTFANYYVGLTLIDLEKTDEAKQVLSSIVADSEYSDIANLARNALAQLEISEGHWEEAIRLLNEILNDLSSTFPQQMILARLAQSYEAVGDNEAALRTYRKISAEYSGSSFATKADSRIEYLELRGVTVEEEEEKPSETPE